MPIPDLTHLQFLVLTALLQGEQSGRDLRTKLAEEGGPKSGPAFYQMMSRLEDAQLIEGWYVQKVIDGQGVKERRYKISAAGVAAWERVVAFYRTHGRPVPSVSPA